MGRLTHLAALLGLWSAVGAASPQQGVEPPILSVTISHPLGEVPTVDFHEAVWPGLPPGVLFTEDTDRLRAALSGAPALGMTALYDALDRAHEHLQRGSTRGRKALIVVSDGGDNARSRTLGAVLEHARRVSAVVYSVTFFDPDDRDASFRSKRVVADAGKHRQLIARTRAGLYAGPSRATVR